MQMRAEKHLIKKSLNAKAPLKDTKDFVERGLSDSYKVMREAVERGLTEWENESQPNN